MMTFLILLLSFTVISLFSYFGHWLLHQPWAGRISKSHLMHHKLYPPSDFYSFRYRHAGKDSATIFFTIASIPLILLPIILAIFNIIPVSLMLLILGLEGLIGFLHNYLHDAIHIQDHWLSNVPVIGNLFKGFIYLHYLHHVDMRCNYELFYFYWDKAFKTFRKI